MGIKKIGIITSGGDCGGLNAVIKGATQMASSLGIETVLIPNGYAGLYNLVDLESVAVMSHQRLDNIEADVAGSEAGHSRVKIKKINDPNKYQRIKDGLKKFGIDGLVISGGDDTGSVVLDLSEKGIPCVHAPKTMDLDLQPYSVGGDSSINRIAEFTKALKTTGKSHNRIMVIEVFGRYVGHTALRGGIAAEADCILIPEIPVDFTIVYEHMKKRFTERVEKSDVRAGTYTIVVSEGIVDAKGSHIVDEGESVDAFGHKKLAGAGKYVRKQLEDVMKSDDDMKRFMQKVGMYAPGIYECPEIRQIVPSHLVRCGATSSYDVNFGKEAGGAAVLLLVNGLQGNTVVNVSGGEISYKATAEAIKQRFVDLNIVSFYENMGVCFGREKVDYKPQFRAVTGQVSRPQF